MTTLSIQQQFLLDQMAETGALLRDCLFAIGCTPEQVEQLSKDHDVRALYDRARASGVKRVRAALAASAAQGNVSAAKALKLHEHPDQQANEDEARPVYDGPAISVAAYRQIEKLFERQTELNPPDGPVEYAD